MEERTEAAVLRTKTSIAWMPLIGTAAGAVLLPTLIELSTAFDFGSLFYFLLLAPVLALVLLGIAIRKRTLSSWLMPVLFCVVTWVCWRGGYTLRTHGRWLLGSRSFKAELFRQTDPPAGEMKHMDWDGWGFAGSETEVYLVFDPTDALRAASASESPGKYNGIPCEVYRVHRLEKYWYSVVFFTNTDWTSCS